MPTANPMSEHIKALLASYVATSGWTVEIGQLPDEGVAQVIAIIDTPAPPADPKWLLDFPTVQVIVRGEPNAYLATWREAKSVKDVILGVTSYETEVDGDRIVSITMAGDIGYLERDKSQRHLFSMNFNMIVQPFASGETNRLELPG